MAHNPKLLDYLESLARAPWTGLVFRYTAGRRPPNRENTLGARWNRKDEPAIYTALKRETAIEELRHNLLVNAPTPSRGSFTMYSIQVTIAGVVDLGPSDRIAGVGLTPRLLASDDYLACQAVGSAARFLGMGGLQVPSARRKGGVNLVIFPDLHTGEFEFDVQAEELLTVGVGVLAM